MTNRGLRMLQLIQEHNQNIGVNAPPPSSKAVIETEVDKNITEKSESESGTISSNNSQSTFAENNIVVRDGKNEPSSSSSSSSDSSSSSSSSSSSCESTDEDSSEDCEDLINDQTYVPTKSNESESESESESEEEYPNLNSNKQFQNSIINKSEITNVHNNLNPNVPKTEITLESIANSTIQNVNNLISPLKKGLKRKRDERKWKRNVLKASRNSGKSYKMHTEQLKVRKERKVKATCGEKCKLECSKKFNEEERLEIFTSYWEIGDIEKQRQFISNSMQSITPRYRYIRIGGTRSQRKNNNAFYFNLNNQRIRVCKIFFKNTLDINDRPIRTVLDKQNKVANVLLEPDMRGKHDKHKCLDPKIREGIKQHIDSIPKIESHYIRAKSTRLFIDGSKSIADIHKDYIAICNQNKVPFANYTAFYRIFTKEYNISFFTPKKDLCETCVAFDNADGEQKKKLEEKYNQHLIEKNLSREHKKTDKEDTDATVVVYDLQAVMQLPKGDVSLFYYRSKLNVFNFTMYNLKTNECECFVWDEGNGNRGVNELGTCVLQYLKNIAINEKNKNIIFYTDNCAGQQKNKFMLALYMYAIRTFGLKSITHKFLIKGHTQNEGDSSHSLIERMVKRILRSGPMYTPDSFVSAIRSARKNGIPFHVNEFCYEDFLDIKALVGILGPLNMSAFKLSEVKVLKLESDFPNSVFYKYSYADENFKEVVLLKKKRSSDSNVTLPPAFHTRPGISQKKKEDLLDLVQKNAIPNFYKTFYEKL